MLVHVLCAALFLLVATGLTLIGRDGRALRRRGLVSLLFGVVVLTAAACSSSAGTDAGALSATAGASAGASGSGASALALQSDSPTYATLSAAPAPTTQTAAPAPSTQAPAPSTHAAAPSTHAPAPPVTHPTTPAPQRTTSAPTQNLCGAPSNPDGYNYCGGSLIYSPAGDVCDYFTCINNFWNGKGYMVECRDGTVSMSGGRSGACSDHGGEERPVYS